MRFSTSARPRLRAASTTAAVAALVAALAACDGDRLRPGPPELTLTGPAGSTVFSPDTIAVGVFATDANGLDSVAVAYLGQVVTIEAFAQSEIDDFAFFFVPEGLSPGQMVVITGVAVDLTGQTTQQTLNLTVVARP